MRSVDRENVTSGEQGAFHTPRHRDAAAHTLLAAGSVRLRRRGGVRRRVRCRGGVLRRVRRRVRRRRRGGALRRPAAAPACLLLRRVARRGCDLVLLAMARRSRRRGFAGACSHLALRLPLLIRLRLLRLRLPPRVRKAPRLRCHLGLLKHVAVGVVRRPAQPVKAVDAGQLHIVSRCRGPRPACAADAAAARV